MVNDCAFVGGTLIKYLPSFFNVVHIKRTRRFFDKTFGVFWKILRCTAEYFPIPYDPEIFYPKPLFINRKVKQILLVSPHNFRTK
jgi:hypothetical protein